MNQTKRPISVCHITSVHPVTDVRIFVKQCRSLAEAGYDVSLIARGTESEIKNKVKIVGLPPTKGGRLYRMTIAVLSVFKAALKESARIYHLHDPELLPMGVMLKLVKGKKVIYDAHEDYAKQKLSVPYLPKTARKFVGSLIKAAEYLSSKIFDGVVTATDDILKNFSHHKRAVSVRNFPVLSLFAENGRSNDDEEEIFRLVYIGDIDEIRGIRETIQALGFFHRNEKLNLTLCGKYNSPAYEEEIKSIKGHERMEYLGWIEPLRIPDLLKNFDAGIVCLHPLPNYVTSLPVKLFEYMASGLPVIASNFPLWKEIVLGNQCGDCVDPLNPRKIADAIKHLMANPALRKKMGENGRKAVVEKYNWENESKKLIRLYGEILGEQHAR